MEQPPVLVIQNNYLTSVNPKNSPAASGSTVAGRQDPDRMIVMDESTWREQV